MPVSGRKRQVAGKIRRLADQMETDHPEMGIHAHLRDAAGVLDRGVTHGAIRHLQTAAHALTPQSLYRHGMLTDDAHTAARRHMHDVTRHILLIKDIQDTETENNSRSERRSQIAGSQPPGNQAMNAPARLNTGGPGNEAQGPKQPEPAHHLGLASGPLPYRREPDETVTCPFCGKGDAPDARFCDQCGRRLPDSAFAHLASPAGGVELAYNPMQPRDRRGRWSDVPGGMDTPNMRLAERAGFVRALGADQAARRMEHPREARPQFSYPGQPGDFGHVRAMLDAAENIRVFNDTAGNAVHNAARAVAMRDLPSARSHLAEALTASRGTGSSATVRGILKSLDSVPPGVYSQSRPGMAPESLQAHRGGPGYYPARAAIGFATELSAQTARLAVTPAPRGKPGGPGLYHVKGNEHSPYLQQVVKALIEKRGMPPGKAYAIATNALKRWKRGGGHVHPEVQAAAGGALGLERVAAARAKGHAVSDEERRWQVLDLAIELAGTSAGAAKDARTPAGQFGAASAGKAKSKAQIEQKIKNLRSELTGLIRQYNSMAAHPLGSSSPSRGKSATPASKTKGGTSSTTASTAAAANKATAAASSTQHGSTKPLTARQKAQRAAIHARIVQIREQIHQLTAQAAKL